MQMPLLVVPPAVAVMWQHSVSTINCICTIPALEDCANANFVLYQLLYYTLIVYAHVFIDGAGSAQVNMLPDDSCGWSRWGLVRIMLLGSWIHLPMEHCCRSTVR